MKARWQGGSGTLPTIRTLSECSSEHKGMGEGLRDGVGGKGVSLRLLLYCGDSGLSAGNGRRALLAAAQTGWRGHPGSECSSLETKLVWVSCSPGSSVQPLTNFLVAKQKCVGFPVCFSPPRNGLRLQKGILFAGVGRISPRFHPEDVPVPSVQRKGLEGRTKKDKDAGAGTCVRGPSPRPNSTRAGPAACGARSAPARPL